MSKAVNKAYHAVREGIVRGTYPAASRITEQKVAAAAGVSRTPVREALRKLQAEGLLEFVPHHGAIVRQWNTADGDDLFEIRAMLESYGAARACGRVPPAGIAELRQLAEEQYHETLSKHEGYLVRVARLNSQFHRRIHEFAGSARLLDALASLIDAPLMLNMFASYEDKDLVCSCAHHLEIVRALDCGNEEWSAALMRAHILGSREVNRN